MVKDVDDMADMGGKGAEILFDALLVADVGVHRLERRKLRTRLRRNVQPGLGHQRQMIETQIHREEEAVFMTANNRDDGIIDPRDTRTVLGMTLSAVHSNVVAGTNEWGVFRM